MFRIWIVRHKLKGTWNGISFMLKIEMKIFFLALIICTSVFGGMDSTRVRFEKIVISGNQLLSGNDIKARIPPGEYSKENLENAIRQLLEQYSQQGHLKARMAVKDSAGQLFLAVNEGPHFQLGDIVLSGVDSSRKALLRKQLDFRDRQFVSSAINENLNSLLDYLENNGFPFCVLGLDSLTITSNEDSLQKSVLCHVLIDQGPRISIDSLVVSGNKVTRRNVIFRESRLKKRQLYDHSQVSRIQSRLMKTGFFSAVEAPQIFIDDYGNGILFIRVKESNPNQLNAVFGYNPKTSSNSRGYITGLIDVAFRNLLGTGRVLEAYWSKKDQRSQELRFRYMEPWIKGWPLNIGGGFQQIIQDTTFIRRNVSLDVEVPYSDVLTFFSNLSREQVLPDSIGRELYQLPKSSSWQAQIGFSYDTRDSYWNPSRGVMYKTHYEYAQKRIIDEPQFDSNVDETASFRRDRWMIDLEIFIPTLKYQTILLGMHGRHVKTTEPFIPVSDVFRFGGANSLRGYREDEFLGDRIAWLNMEYRYLLASRSRVFAFLDGGYFSRQAENGEVDEDYKLGYGFGLRIETRLGVIGIDYGLGEGRGLTSGLVHIGLTNQF